MSLGSKPRPYYKMVALHVPSELEHAFPYRLLRVGREQYSEHYPTFRRRLMDSHHLVYVEQGRGRLETGGYRGALLAGTVAFLCAGTVNNMAPEPEDPLEITWLAVEQFLPCIVAGALLTVVLALFVPDNLWMLPGLWQMLFGLGIFASHRRLPRPTLGVAMFYLLAGVLCLALARGEAALSPWAMCIPFGVGQLYAAAVLYWTLERGHDEQ